MRTTKADLANQLQRLNRNTKHTYGIDRHTPGEYTRNKLFAGRMETTPRNIQYLTHDKSFDHTFKTGELYYTLNLINDILEYEAKQQ